MSTQLELKVSEINEIKPAMIAGDARVEKKFITMYNSIWGNDMGMQVYEKEKFNFNKIIREKPELSTCTPISLFGCFLDIAVNGLSLDPTGRPHCYLLSRNTKTGYKDPKTGKDIYEKRAYLSITGYGELVMRQRAGQVRYVDNPVVCYEGDTFSPGLVDGVKTVTYKAACPRKSNKVIGGFIRIVRADGTVDWNWMMEGDIDRLRIFSERNNTRFDPKTQQMVGKANSLYTSNNGGIDPGFLESKLIKHAFDSYPKVRTGRFTVFETQEEPQEIDYGIVPDESGADGTFQQQPEQRQDKEPIPVQAAEEVPFGEENTPQAETVKVNVTDEDENVGF
ncbi:MAG: recombinase RecT [Parabacteroides sp.]|nr:recombinase RecT [Parabacteroides sp.]